MEFSASAEHYDRFMGRYTRTLAPALADAAGVAAGHAGARRGLRAGRAGRASWPRASAPRTSRRSIPPPQFVGALSRAQPGADVREGVAEALPWADGEFDAALSSLVIAFMRDPDGACARWPA